MMNIKKNICITTNVSILFKMHNTLQEKYDTLQEKYNTLQEKYDTLVTKKDIIVNMEIQNNSIINNDELISHDDTISDIINDIIDDIINKIDDFEFIESNKPNSSYILIKCDSKTIWSKFTKKFLYG